MPGVDFQVWGEQVMGTVPLGTLPPNLTLNPPYARFADLPLHKASAFLYTSGWDGVPQILLEIAMSGLPIVGTDVGGTGEVLDPALSFPVPETAGAQAYVTRLQEVLTNQESARAQALTLRDHLCNARTQDHYRDLVRRAAGWDKG